MNILITGGLGFIGINLIRKISKNKKYKLRILDKINKNQSTKILSSVRINHYHLSANFKKKYTTKLQYFSHDLRKSKNLDNILFDTEIIIHLAASTGVLDSFKDPMNDFNNNVLGTLNLLEISRNNNVKKFIFASSSAPLGNVNIPISEILPLKPLSPYGSSKASVESYLSSYFHSYGLSSVILRFSNIYGPGSFFKTSVIAKFIKKIFHKSEIEIFGNGNQSRDFIYIDDVTSAIVKSLNFKKKSCEIFQICSGRQTSINEIINSLKIIVKHKGLAFPKITRIRANKAEIYRNIIINKKAKKELGWYSKETFQNGLTKTFDYFFDNFKE